MRRELQIPLEIRCLLAVGPRREMAIPLPNLPLAKMKKSFYFLQRTEFAISLPLPQFLWAVGATSRHRREKRCGSVSGARAEAQIARLHSQDSPRRRGASGRTGCHRTPPVEETGNEEDPVRRRYDGAHGESRA